MLSIASFRNIGLRHGFKSHRGHNEFFSLKIRHANVT
jgi:hypothetical protein